jgi:hypothetical protein
MSTVDNCTEKNNYNGKETLILKDIDFSMDCKILLQQENPNFDNTIVNIVINKMVFTFNEFQILLMIEFIGNNIRDLYKVQIDIENLRLKEEVLKQNRMKEKEIFDKSKNNKTITEMKEELDRQIKEKMDIILYEEKKKKQKYFIIITLNLSVF